MQPKVIIATPAHDGRVEAGFALCLAETVRLGCALGVDVRFLAWPGEAILQFARNELFALAYGSDATDLIWIDGDEEWEPQWVMQLLKHPVDVVGGTARRKS